MIIFLRELAKNRKSFIIWTVVMVLLNLMMMSVYPTYADNAKKMQEMLENYPEGFVKAFGMGNLDLSQILHYFGVEAYLFITLLGSIYAMLLGSSILSKEESEKTIEFLLAKPVTRNTIVTAKGLCALFYIALFNAILVAVDYMLFEMFKKGDYSMNLFLLLSAAPFLLHMTFAAIGFVISVFIVKAKSVYPLSIGVVLGLYFLSIASAVSDKLENLKYLTPFEYVSASRLLTKERIEPVYLVIMLCVITLSVAATYVIYNKKNISV
ncbi:MAG: ABC transporter permease [Clostridia bacterium]|nr:ABC transporter permease [Clostridia bacterium]